MSDVQRWDMFAEVGINEPVKYDMWEAVEGRYVTYADHVATVAAAEQQAGEQAHGHYMDGYNAAWSLSAAEIERQTVGKCRDAVAAMRPETDPDIAHVIVSDVLDAIDGVEKP